MSSRISIFNYAGNKIAEIDAYFRRTWKLNEFGEGEIELSIEDAKANFQYLKYGNLIYAEHDKLPAWGGVIYTPRDWKQFSTITVNCYSAEYLLKFRATPMVLKSEGAAGQVFADLINNTYPKEYPLPVDVGDIWGGGDAHKLTHNYQQTYEAIATLAENTGYEWDLTPVIEGGRLYFRANWYDAKGVTRALRLIENINLELNSTPMVEQGEIANYLIGYGAGSTWSTKPISEAIDQSAVNEYGLFAKVVGFEEGQKAQIKANTQAQLDYHKQPRITFDLNALDKGETFSNIRVGDTLPIELYSCGFTNGELGYQGYGRVTGMTYDEKKNLLELVLNEA